MPSVSLVRPAGETPDPSAVVKACTDDAEDVELARAEAIAAEFFPIEDKDGAQAHPSKKKPPAVANARLAGGRVLPPPPGLQGARARGGLGGQRVQVRGQEGADEWRKGGGGAARGGVAVARSWHAGVFRGDDADPVFDIITGVPEEDIKLLDLVESMKAADAILEACTRDTEDVELARAEAIAAEFFPTQDKDGAQAHPLKKQPAVANAKLVGERFLPPPLQGRLGAPVFDITGVSEDDNQLLNLVESTETADAILEACTDDTEDVELARAEAIAAEFFPFEDTDGAQAHPLKTRPAVANAKLAGERFLLPPLLGLLGAPVFDIAGVPEEDIKLLINLLESIMKTADAILEACTDDTEDVELARAEAIAAEFFPIEDKDGAQAHPLRKPPAVVNAKLASERILPPPPQPGLHVALASAGVRWPAGPVRAAARTGGRG